MICPGVLGKGQFLRSVSITNEIIIDKGGEREKKYKTKQTKKQNPEIITSFACLTRKQKSATGHRSNMQIIQPTILVTLCKIIRFTNKEAAKGTAALVGFPQTR